ncbi:endopeptidase La [Candidatus Sumerlaeota bacterium]|nr:endopeptidase La [Candidatus Sumerlaeota bacterium]
MDNDKQNAIVPLIPLKEAVIFPRCVAPIYVYRSRSMAALEEALSSTKMIFLTTQKSVEIENPLPEDFYHKGTVAEVLQVLKIPDGSAKILVEGYYVAEIIDFLRNERFYQVLVRRLEPRYHYSKQMEALTRSVVSEFERYAHLSEKVPDELLLNIRSISDPPSVANIIAHYSALRTEDKQKLLETLDVEKSLFMLLQYLRSENEILELENKIMDQVKSRIGKSQKEYYLGEQLKVIEKELGLSHGEDIELADLRRRLKKTKLSAEARQKVEKELGRLSKMQPLSPEATVARTYIEWILDLPWNKFTNDHFDIERAQKVLDEDHYGLTQVKERIVEFLAVNKLAHSPRKTGGALRGPILCFVGAPGVGKTSLGKSIARALGRKFIRISLGGVRDEAEIRGHRRTYVGAMPGKIIQGIKKGGTMNPVFLLDEVDKMGLDFRGDPAAALLEVLDPEQNKAFNDHYLEIDFDLSRVLFITTANTTEGIPPALVDRMEIIRLPGYTHSEKLEIAKRHLIPKQLELHSLDKGQIIFSEEGIKTIIDGYTREAGVRNLEREIANICRKVAKEIVRKQKRGSRRLKQINITPEKVREYLGPQRYSRTYVDKTPQVGVATGLAWTEFGGEILATETAIMHGKGELVLTGQLGDVMQESAKTALSYIRSRYKMFKINKDFYRTTDIHVHIPEGAIPKDGPSAGVTLAVSMASALSGRAVRQDIAMTGEITLRGKILRIGGLKEKVLAAHRAGVPTVIIPEENKDELEEIPENVKKDLKFITVQNLDEVLNLTLVNSPAERKRTKRTQRRKRAERLPLRRSNSRQANSLA